MSSHKDLKKTIEKIKEVQATPRPITQTRKIDIPKAPKVSPTKEVVEEVKLNRLIRKEQSNVSGKRLNVPGCNNYF